MVRNPRRIPNALDGLTTPEDPEDAPDTGYNPDIATGDVKIETLNDAKRFVRDSEVYNAYLEKQKADVDDERDAIVEAEWSNIGTIVRKYEGDPNPVYLYKKGKGKYTPKSFKNYQQKTNQLIENIDSAQETIKGNIELVSTAIENVENELAESKDVGGTSTEPTLEKTSEILYESEHEDRVQAYEGEELWTPTEDIEKEITQVVTTPDERAQSSNLPDPDTFEGILGPASGPAPGSLGEKIQDALMEPINYYEDFSVGFESDLSGAGKQAGVEAQQALAEGDYLEAGLKGIASASALLGAGAFQDLTFFIRPLAIGKAMKGIGQVVTDRDLESEEAASQIRDTISKGESDYAEYQKNYDAIIAQYEENQKEFDLFFSNREDYTPESYEAWESSWVKYSSDVVGLKTSHAETQKDYEEFTEWRSEAEDLLVELDKSPRTRVSESVINAFTSDQGAIVQFVGGIFSGYLMSKAFSALKGPTKTLTRLDDVDITVRSTNLDINQFPEAELFPTTSTRKLPKIVSEILEPELDDLSGGRLLGVADDGGYATLTKIDLPEGVIDDLLEGKTVDVQYSTKLLEDQVVTKQGTIGVENVVWGNQKFVYVDEIISPLSDTKILSPIKENVLSLDAKEIGESLAIPESSTGKRVEFNSLWDAEGVKGVLSKGKYSFDIKGMVFDSKVVLDDVLDDIQKIEPTPRPKTSFAEHFQQPGYTEPLGDLGESLSRDMDIVRNLADDIDNLSVKQGLWSELSLVNELTQGVVPVSKVVTKTSKSSPSVAAAMGFGATLDFVKGEPSGSPIDFYVSMDDLGLMPNLESGMLNPVIDVKDAEKTNLFPIDFTVNIDDIVVILQPIKGPKTSIDFVPIIDFKPIGESDITDLKPKPVPDIMPVPPIEVVYSVEIPDVITIPVLDTIPKPVQDIIQKPDQMLDLLFSPTMFAPSGGPPPFLIRPPRRQRRGKPDDFLNPMGWEMREYPESEMMDILGLSLSKTKKKKRKKRTKK